MNAPSLPICSLPEAALDTLMPMHLSVGADGVIRHVGPTIAKMSAPRSYVGRKLEAAFRVRRPMAYTSLADLVSRGERHLRLELEDNPQIHLKGLVVSDGCNGHLINVSFGISIVEALRVYPLTAADFSATDLTIEMLYLVEANRGAMDAWRDLSERLDTAKNAAETQAFSDTLTGVMNRRGIENAILGARARSKAYALMIVDLDYFKAVNDTMGHAAGDHVLQRVARILIEETRDTDGVGRLGGDEFVVVLDRISDRERLAAVGNRVIARLEEPIPFQDQVCRISGSIGVAISSDYANDEPDAVLEAADRALYASKNGGRGRVTLAHADGGYEIVPRPDLDAR
ncbi:MAG: GGDEF domain-containing protein [Pseudomonadota bacterium]